MDESSASKAELACPGAERNNVVNGGQVKGHPTGSGDSSTIPQKVNQSGNSPETGKKHAHTRPSKFAPCQVQTVDSEKPKYVVTSSPSRTSTTASAPFCRICHDDENMEKLISPCNCKGSLNYCHSSCLHTWLTEKVKKLKEPSCEICKCKYEVRYERVGPRDLKAVWKQFRERREFIHLVVVAFCSLVLAASIAYTCWGAFSNSRLAANFRVEPLAELTYCVYIIIDILCLLVIVVEFRVGLWPVFKKWWNSNVSVVVLDKNRVTICTENLRRVEEASSLLEEPEGETTEEETETETEDEEAEVVHSWCVRFWPHRSGQAAAQDREGAGDADRVEMGRSSSSGNAAANDNDNHDSDNYNNDENNNNNSQIRTHVIDVKNLPKETRTEEVTLPGDNTS